jgi:hypothetical protein
LFEQTNQISRASDGYMLERTCGGFGNRVGQTGGAPLWNKDSVNGGAFGCAQDRTQIARIFDAIQNQNQRRSTAADSVADRVQQIFGILVSGRGHACHHALVITRSGFAIDYPAGHAPHRNIPGPGLFNQLAQPLL